MDPGTESEERVDTGDDRTEPGTPEMIESEDEETEEEIGLEKEDVGPHRNPLIIEALKALRKQRESLMEDVMEANKNARGTPKEELIARVIRIFTGDVDIDLKAVEKEFLALGPDFALQDILDDEAIERDFMAALTKIRWSRTGKSEDEIRREILEEEMEKPAR